MTSQHQHSYGLRHPRSIVGMTQPDSSSSSATPEPSSSSTNSSATLAPPHTELLSAIEALSEHFLAFSSRYPPGTLTNGGSSVFKPSLTAATGYPPGSVITPQPTLPQPTPPSPQDAFRTDASVYLQALSPSLFALFDPKCQQLPLPLGRLSLLKHSSSLYPA